MPIPIIIDSDMALDDWMAILYLLQNPEADVKAITVCATGETHARPGIHTAIRLLTLTGHPLIPIASGTPRPLIGDHVFPFAVRFAVDFRLFVKMPIQKEYVPDLDALSLLIQKLEEAEEPLTILAIGPLTNLAEIFLQRPDLAHKVAKIILMGGAVNVPGNIMSVNPKIDNPYSEWNIYIDPYAANVVFSSGVPIDVVPLDATNQVPLNREFLDKLAEQKEIPAIDFLFRALTRIAGLSKGERIFYFWDPLAAVLALHPEIATFETCKIRVVENEGAESGRIIRAEDGYSVRVCTGVDREIFEKVYLEGLHG